MNNAHKKGNTSVRRVDTLVRKDSTLSHLATDFLQYLQAQRRMSMHTISAYRRDIEILLIAAQEKNIETLDSTVLRGLLAADSRRGLMPASIARRLSAWRMFFDYQLSCGVISVNPTHGLRAPKKAARLPRALTPDEMTHFLDGTSQHAARNVTDIRNAKNNVESNNAPPINKWQAARDAAMFELLYASGMRVSELTQLDISDIDLSSSIARIVRGKGGRGRLAPFGNAAKKALHTWLQVRESTTTKAVTTVSTNRHVVKNSASVSASSTNRHVVEKSSSLFINTRGGRLSTRTVQQRAVLQAQRTGMHGRVSPHVLRHSCASHFLQSSQNLRATQELLGHADISSTQIYTRLDFQNLADSYDRAHPRANIKSKKIKSTHPAVTNVTKQRRNNSD